MKKKHPASIKSVDASKIEHRSTQKKALEATEKWIERERGSGSPAMRSAHCAQE
jgi:hypothetical protein